MLDDDGFNIETITLMGGEHDGDGWLRLQWRPIFDGFNGGMRCVALIAMTLVALMTTRGCIVGSMRDNGFDGGMNSTAVGGFDCDGRRYTMASMAGCDGWL